MRKVIFFLLTIWYTSALADKGKKTDEQVSKRPSSLASTQLSQLNQSVGQFALQNQAQVLAPDRMLDLLEEVSTDAGNDRAVASSLMSYLDNNQAQVKEEVEWNDLVVLPVGLKKKIGDNATVTVGILKAEFKPTFALLTVFIRLTTPVNSSSSTEKTRDLFFGVEGLKITKQAGFSASSFKAVLLGDYLLPMKDWTVYLKGGLDKSETPADNDPLRTYIKFDCSKFENLNVAAKIVVPRSKLLPCTTAGKVIDDPSVRVTIDNLRFTTSKGLRDVLFEVGTITPFALPNHREYAYAVQSLAFDISDIANPIGLENGPASFPVGYQGDTDAKWQGLYVKAFTLIMPEEFEEDGTSARLTVTAKDIYWDRTGFSGLITLSGLNKKVNAKKWKLTLKSFQLGFLQNQFKYGRFSGGVETPVHKENASEEELFNYDAEIYMGIPMDGSSGKRSNYNLTVKTSKDMPLDFLFAKGTITEGSMVFLSLEYTTATGYKFKPRAVLSGSLRIGVSTNTSEQASKKFEAEKGVSFDKVVFNKLVIQTTQPFVSIEEFAYVQGNGNKLVNFPVQITKFQKYEGSIDGFSNDGEFLLTEVGVGLDLLKGKIGGSTELIIVSKYVNGKLRPEKVKVQDVMIKGELPTISFYGRLSVKENAERKEVFGQMKVGIKKPTAFEAGVSVLFARDNTIGKYGFVDAYVLVDGGTGIPMGPVNLYGAGIGVYWNMVVTDAACPECYEPLGDGMLRYKKDQSVKFGVKLMAAIKDPGPNNGGKSTFKARVYLDLAINDDWGIKHIGIYGNGVIAGDFLGGDNKTMQLDFAKKYAKHTGDNAASTINASANTNKAKLINGLMGNGNESPNPSTGPPASKISFTAGILFDFERKIFDLRADAYLKAGDLIGVGPYGRMANLQMHFENQNNYIYIGKSPKSERIGIKFGENLRIDAYLMIGRGVGAFPEPAPEVMEFFPSLRGADRYKYPDPNVANGKGFAMGASAKVLIAGGGKRWYANGMVIAGLDLIISDVSCSGEIGKDWFGKGQLYGLVKLDAGYRNKNNTRNVKIVSLGLGIYSYLQAPDPFGMDLQACIEVPRWIPGSSKKCIGFTVGKTSCN